MTDRYFVAQAPGAGVVGLLAGPEVRRRLAVGELTPTFVGLPQRATGEVRGQWRPLAELFAGLAGPAPPPSPAGADRGVGHRGRGRGRGRRPARATRLNSSHA